MATRAATINVRLDPTLKATGEAALASIGLSTSAAVRRLWEVATRRGEGLHSLKAILLDNSPSHQLQGLEEFRAGYTVADRLTTELNLAQPRYTNDFPSDDELREEAYIEELERLEAVSAEESL